MIIIFFTRKFYPAIGGVEKHVLEISRILKQEKFEIKIITENIDNRLKSYEEINGIKIYRINHFNDNKLKKFRIWIWFFKNIKLIKSANVIHIHDVFYWYLPYRFLFPRKKVFTTFHGYETVFPPKKNVIVLRRLIKFLSNETINIGEYISKWYKTSAKFTIYGGVNKDNLNKINNFKNKVIEIIFVGRIERDNGIETYAKILEELKIRKIKFNFLALGDGSMSNYFKAYGKVAGFKENIDKYIKNKDIIFASSYLSILEAFSVRKIVVCVWENELKKDYLEMVPFKDFIIKGNNEKDIVNQVLNLSENKKNKMINGAYNFVKENTWEDVVKVYKKLWNL